MAPREGKANRGKRDGDVIAAITDIDTLIIITKVSGQFLNNLILNEAFYFITFPVCCFKGLLFNNSEG